MAIRILFVDDDPGIRETFPAILEYHDFEVRSAATVRQALAEIAAHQFEVLIADLNIGEPGDGFTVVSAMRRTQPDCITLILTGYPALETALQAIRSQVDDYIIKPAKVSELVESLRSLLRDRKTRPIEPTKRVADILHSKVAEIARRTVQHRQADPALGQLQPEQTEAQQLHCLIEGLALQLRSDEPSRVPAEVVAAARIRGESCHREGFTVEMLLENIRVFEQVIFDVIHESLFSLNLSYLMLDVKQLNDSLGWQLQHTILGYLAAQRWRAP